jgi:hypothetical protein
MLNKKTRINTGASLTGLNKDYALRHLSGLPPAVLRTRSTRGEPPLPNSRARAIASAWVGKTALALSELPFLTA